MQQRLCVCEIDGAERAKIDVICHSCSYLHTTLAAVQLAFTFFVIAQTGLFPIHAYLVDRFSPRVVVALASVLVGAGWIGAGFA